MVFAKVNNEICILFTTKLSTFMFVSTQNRQNYGYQGRTNKDPDSCYSFWIGATLAMLNQFETTDVLSTKSFLLNDCQFEPYGGFCKLPETYPDLLHTFYSIAWLSMVGELSMNKINPELGFCDNRVNLH